MILENSVCVLGFDTWGVTFPGHQLAWVPTEYPKAEYPKGNPPVQLYSTIVLGLQGAETEPKSLNLLHTTVIF